MIRTFINDTGRNSKLLEHFAYSSILHVRLVNPDQLEVIITRQPARQTDTPKLLLAAINRWIQVGHQLY